MKAIKPMTTTTKSPEASSLHTRVLTAGLALFLALMAGSAQAEAFYLPNAGHTTQKSQGQHAEHDGHRHGAADATSKKGAAQTIVIGIPAPPARASARPD